MTTTGSTSGPSPKNIPNETFRPFKPKSPPAWLGPSLLMAKIIAQSAECAPFPHVQGAFGTIVVVLETIEKVKNNRDDLEELCGDVIEIMKILQGQVSSHGTTAAVKFKSVCEEFESVLQDVLKELQKLQESPRGLCGHVKRMVKSRSTADKISEYQRRVQALCLNLKLMAAVDTNFQVHKIDRTLTALAPNLHVPQVAQSINTCPLPSRIFQGRQTILAKMHQYFAEDLMKQHIYVLYGLGGAGKTQIALRFIMDSATKFSDIFLIDTSTAETIDAGLKSIANRKQVGDTAQDALDWLCSNKNGWLLFFDNADDPQIDLHNFLPPCIHGNILITSRNPQLRGYGAYSLVSDMEETDAVELLLSSAAPLEVTLENRDTAFDIVKVLCYLPLAIVQAGAYILRSGSLKNYLTLYNSNQEQLLKERPTQSHGNYAWTVYTTWQLSFNQLSQPAAMLLQLCSLLHHEGISESMFKDASLYKPQTSGPSMEELEMPHQFLSQFLHNGIWDSLQFCNVTNEIQAYSLINFDATRNLFSIHPLVHNWSRNTLTHVGLYHSCMASIVGMSIDQIPEEDIELASISLLPHIYPLLRGDHLVTPDFRAHYGRVLYYGGKYTEASKLLADVAEKQRKLNGDDHPQTLLALENLALTFHSLGQFNEAAELQSKVLAKRQRDLGEGHQDTVLAMNNLALTYRWLGRYKEAEELQILTLEKQRKIKSVDHSTTLHAMHDLALISRSRGKFRVAEELQVLILEKRTAKFGVDHPSTLQAMGHLARTYHYLGRSKEAEKFQIVVLEKRRKVLGENHPDSLRALKHLALTYDNLSEFEKAAPLQIMAIEMLSKILGENHPDTLLSQNSLAQIYCGVGQLQDALKLQSMVLDKWRSISGPDDPNTLHAVSNLAVIYQNLGQLQEAEKLQSLLFEKRNEVLGRDHPDTLHTMYNLATCYQQSGQLHKAMELQSVTLEEQSKVIGEKHPETLRTMNSLASIFWDLGQLKEAEELQMKRKLTTNTPGEF
ncbi:hypothetical protein B0H16DRAFT_1541826 [Mycena metata]|uniref:DUF7779 domain-containing protein n=1 Tax=Mycena metata TaxID=1033252 RepID=A0AAD7J486_9AGAR|nr:hypothetical protein B0H16DRAFT_1541826 [Mycena metata]